MNEFQVLHFGREFVIQINVTFSAISIISCLLVADMVLPHLNAMSQAHWYSIPPGHILLLTMGKPTIFPWSNPLMLTTKQRSAKSHSQINGMTWLGIKPETPCTPGERSTTRPLGARLVNRHRNCWSIINMQIWSIIDKNQVVVPQTSEPGKMIFVHCRIMLRSRNHVHESYGGHMTFKIADLNKTDGGYRQFSALFTIK